MARSKSKSNNTAGLLGDAANSLKQTIQAADTGHDDNELKEIVDEQAAIIERQQADLAYAEEHGIIRRPDGTIQYQRVTLHRAYAALPDDMNEQEIDDLAFALLDLDENINFWLGDIIAWLFKARGAQLNEEKAAIYEELEGKYGKSRSALKNAAWIASHVPSSTRVDAPLSFTHYRTLVGATNSADELYDWALKTYEAGWSDRDLREQLIMAGLVSDGSKQDRDGHDWFDNIQSRAKRDMKVYSKSQLEQIGQYYLTLSKSKK